MKLFLLFIFIALSQAPSCASQNLVSKVDQYMHAQMAVNGFTGSILIAQGGRVLLNEGYGLAGVRSPGPDGLDTRFRLGSIAMQFTDMAILQLQDKGRLHVRDSVCKYINECPNDWTKITLVDLMTHTSGIPEISSHEVINSSITDLVNKIEQAPLRFRPGERVDSSYSEEEVLDAVVEAASGEPYLAYLDRHVFVPSGMRDTGYDGSLRMRSRRGEASVLTPSDVQQSLLYTVGGIYSTARDLYLWDRTLATENLASTESLREMFTPYRDGYGFGWMVHKEIGHRLVTSGGGLRTYSTSILRYPDDEVCVVVLSQSQTTDAERVGRDLAAAVFGHHYELPIKPKAIALDPASYDSYVGRYSFTLAPTFVLTVTRNTHSLMVQGDGKAKMELLPESETVFFLKSSDAKITFVKASNGRVSQLILQQGGRDIPAKKIG